MTIPRGTDSAARLIEFWLRKKQDTMAGVRVVNSRVGPDNQGGTVLTLTLDDGTKETTVVLSVALGDEQRSAPKVVALPLTERTAAVAALIDFGFSSFDAIDHVRRFGAAETLKAIKA